MRLFITVQYRVGTFVQIIWLLKFKILFSLGSLKSKKKGQVLEFQNVPGCGLRALVGHLQDLTEAGKQSEDILNYVNLRQKVGLDNVTLYASWLF